jgi:hypothetical protein
MTEPQDPAKTEIEERLPADVAEKLEAIRKAAAFCDSPTADIEQMLAEIELGYLSQLKIEPD